MRRVDLCKTRGSKSRARQSPGDRLRHFIEIQWGDRMMPRWSDWAQDPRVIGEMRRTRAIPSKPRTGTESEPGGGLRCRSRGRQLLS